MKIAIDQIDEVETAFMAIKDQIFIEKKNGNEITSSRFKEIVENFNADIANCWNQNNVTYMGVEVSVMQAMFIKINHMWKDFSKILDSIEKQKKKEEEIAALKMKQKNKNRKHK